MFESVFIGIALISNLLTNSPQIEGPNILGSREFSMENRYPDEWVNGIFKDNILLNLAYMRGIVKDGTAVNWDEVRKPFSYKFQLNEGEVFAFHDDVLPEYDGKVAKTTNAHFNSYEGFKSDGWLVGDGVCQLASFINWAARAAGLDVVSPTDHNFREIPDVPWEYGVSIYAQPGKSYSDQVQNLYVRNNRDKEISFVFNYDGEKLKVSVEEVK